MLLDEYSAELLPWNQEYLKEKDGSFLFNLVKKSWSHTLSHRHCGYMTHKSWHWIKLQYMTEARVFVHVIIWNLIKSTNFTCTLFGKVICVGLHIGIWRYLTSKHRVNCDNEIENDNECDHDRFSKHQNLVIFC